MKAVTTSNIFAKAQGSLKGLPHGFDKICFHDLVKQTEYSLNNANIERKTGYLYVANF